MITIDKIKNAKQAADYYGRLDDYYREGGGAPAELAGRGASFLGIAGAVTGARGDDARLKVFGDVLAGRVGGRQVGDAETRVAGWDVTIQAPKSFSVAAAHDPRLRDTHDAAERAVFGHLERNGIVTRQRAAGGRDLGVSDAGRRVRQTQTGRGSRRTRDIARAEGAETSPSPQPRLGGQSPAGDSL